MITILLFGFFAASAASPTGYCQNGDVLGGQDNPANYYVCENHQWVLKSCLKGYTFNVSSKSCVGTDQICEPGQLRSYPPDDSKFEYCIDGYQWIILSCPNDYIFNGYECIDVVTSTTTTPKPKITSTSQPIKTSPQPIRTTRPSLFCDSRNGLYKPDPNDCTKFYQCDKGYWVLKSCGPGTAWDNLNQVCNYYDLVCR
ncbi:unnamed protein product [Caenorhabditis angaria]|uniref:Chitin-binding type-2 domain-containing protein n=1 Tax=Caenorhabditis angaria TaxID=860376 RepID=A0A9P1IGA7_9PELO|nr:unnamed protein product [Caenorhabditis angaria]